MKGILFTEENYVLSVHHHKTATRRGPAALTKVINANPDQWNRPQIETIPSDFDGIKRLSIDGTYAVFSEGSGNHPKKECIKFRFEVGEIAYVQEPVRLFTKSEILVVTPFQFS